MSTIALGESFVAYDKQGRDGVARMLFYRNLQENQSGAEFLLTNQAVSPSSGRMDGDLIVFSGTETGGTQHLYGALIRQPDIAISEVEFPGVNPDAGAPASGSLSLSNVSNFDFTGDMTVRFFSGHPDADGVQLGSDHVVSNGLDAGAKKSSQFVIPAPTNSPKISQQLHDIYARVYLTPKYDNPVNNTAVGHLLVGPPDLQGPTITSVFGTELHGDGDGIVGADEFVRIAWLMEDSSGVSAAKLFVDGTEVGPVKGLPDGNPTVADAFATVGPLDVGQHTIEVTATDNDVSKETTSQSFTLTVVASEEIAILVDGKLVADGTTDAIDFGTTVYAESAIEKLFVIRNSGRQTLTVNSLQPPSGFAADTSLVASARPGSSTFVRLTLPTDTVGQFTGDFTLLTSDSEHSSDGLDESEFTIPVRGVILPPDYPIVTSIVRSDNEYSNTSAVDFIVTFSENVTGVDVSDFNLTRTGELSNTGVSSVSGSGASYTVRVNTGDGDGTLRLDVIDDESIRDVDQTPLGDTGSGNGDYTRGETYVIDRMPPTVTNSALLYANPSNANSTGFEVVFAENVDGIDVNDFVLTTTGTLSGVSISSIVPATGFSDVFKVAVNTGTGDGTLRLDVADDGSIADAASNLLADTYESGQEYSIDRTAPIVSGIRRIGAVTTKAQSVSFAVTMSESVIGVDTDDFGLAFTGSIALATIQSVVGSGANYTVTVETGIGDGDLRLDLIDTDSIFDSAGNPLGGAGFGNGDFVTGESFDVFTPVEIRGIKWFDVDGNDRRDPGEPALEGWTVYLDENNDGQWNGSTDEPHFALTDSDGEYVISGVRAGTYVVNAVLQTGWLQTYPARAGDKLTHLQTVIDGEMGPDGEGGARAIAVYGNNAYVSRRDLDENMVAVYTRDDAGRLTLLEWHRRHQSGPYGITVSPDGNHVLMVGRTDHTIVVYQRNNETGSLSLLRVYGKPDSGLEDLEVPVDVVVNPNGSHVYVANASRGTTEDPNTVGLIRLRRNRFTGELDDVSAYHDIARLQEATSVAASADGRHVYVAGGDENTVGLFRWSESQTRLIFVKAYGNGEFSGESAFDHLVSIAVSDDGRDVFVVSRGSSSGIDTLVSFKRNEESGELHSPHVYRNGHDGVREMYNPTSVAVSTGGYHVYVTSPRRLVVFRRRPETGELQFLDVINDRESLGDSLRVTVSPDDRNVYVAGDGDGTLAVFGRSVSVPPMHTISPVSGQTILNIDFGNTLLPADFGDAPESYSTTIFNLGARHLTESGLRLGSLIDDDPDGQPTDAANGDDQDSGGDDDDGVTLPDQLFVDEIATIEITASATGILNGWIDFNNNGNWADDGEQVFKNINLSAGDNTLNVAIPSDALLTSRTYARFRFSSESDLSYDGPAIDGEVEDYAIAIAQHQGRITGRKWHDIDEDGIYEPGDGEVPLSGWTVFLDQSQDGTFDNDEPWTLTSLDDPSTAEDETGTYSFNHLSPGTRHVAELLIPGWKQTSPRLPGGGGLTFLEAKKNGVDGVSGMLSPRGLAASPDGQYLYIASRGNDAVTVFHRDRVTDALKFVESEQDGVNGVNGLGGAFGLTVSPDGNHVYVVGDSDQAMAVFKRDTSTGTLDYVDSYFDGTDGVDGLNGTRGVTVSPDNKHVYVTGGGENAVAVFGRNTTTGELQFLTAYKDGNGDIDGIRGSARILVSPDNRHVYVSANVDNAVTVFNRDESDGTLDYVDSYTDDIDAAYGLAISPNGNHLYVTSANNDSVVVFSRDSETGRLTHVESKTNGIADVTGLKLPLDVSISPDGAHVYATGESSNALVVFSRDELTGRLTYVESQIDDIDDVDGLVSPASVLVNPDGNFVYATSHGDAAVAVFRRASSQLKIHKVLVNADELVENIDFGNAVNVDHVNLVPENSVPTAQIITEDTSLTFSTETQNAISMADPDAGGLDLSVTLSVHNGTLRLDSTNHVVFTDGANDSETMSFVGSELAINTVLNGLTYIPTADFSGSEMLSLTTDDLGHSGNGGALTDTDVFEITVTPVNDAPTLDALSGLTIDEDAEQQTVNLAGITAGGGESQPLKVTATSDNTGLIPHPAETYTTAEATGSLKFTPVTDQSGTATITVTVEDGGPDGDLDTPGDNATFSRTFDVTVNAVNDAPTLDSLADLTINEDAGQQTVNLTGITAGSGESQPLKVTATSDNTGLIPHPAETYTTAEATGTLKFTPLSNQSGTATITVTVEDGGLDGDLDTLGDNATFSRTFDITVNANLEILGPVGVSSEQRPTITWTSVSDATSYEIWMEQIGGSNNPLVNPTVSGTSYTFMEDLGVGAYRTWLRATLSNGVKTNWARQNFQVSLAPQLADIPYRDPDRTPTISWGPIPGALQYRLYVSNLTVGGSAVIDELTTETSFTPTEDFGFGRYRIWCRAIGVGNYAAAWSTSEKYYVGPDPVSPTFSTFNDQPSFQWESMPGSSSFQLYVQQGQSVPINVSGLTETSYTPDTPLGVGLHRWWIRAFHESGRAGDWSHHAELDVGGRPKITAPSGTVDDSTPTIAWEPVDGAGSYEVYLYNDDGLGLVHRRTNITQSHMRLPLMPDGNFRVWVKSYKADGNHGLWSRSQSFVIDAATSQVTATPVSPLTATFDRTPAFVWDGSTQAVSYDLYLTDGTDIVEFTGSSTSFVPQTNLAVGDWKWWVRAVDSNSDKGEWSTEASVHVGGRPNVLAPMGSTNTTTPTIRWTAVEGAGRYILLLETLAGVSVFRDNNLTATEYTIDVPSGEYRIWVKAISADDDFSGFWSRPVEFSVTQTKDRLQQGKSPLDVMLIDTVSFLPTVTPDVLPANRHDEDVTKDTVAENAEVNDSETEMQSSISISSVDHDVVLGSQAGEVPDHSHELLDNLMTTLGETAPRTCVLDFVP